MVPLTAYTRPGHCSKAIMPHLLCGRVFVAPFRTAKISRPQRDTRRSMSMRASTPSQGGVRPEAENAFLPSVEVDTESDRAVAGADTLFDESFGQTVYVEKGEVGNTDSIPTAPALRLAEVVPDSPSFNLVRQKPSMDAGRQRRRILAEVLFITSPSILVVDVTIGRY